MHKICAAVRHEPNRTVQAIPFPEFLSKSLIYIGFGICFFYRQFKKSLDSQGLWRRKMNLSTKLSTENLDMSRC
jgi:hypothetical protein